MKNAIKLYALLLTVIAVIMVGACKKDASSSDFRNALIGSYACTAMSSYSNPNTSAADTVRDTIVVIKCQSNDSAIVMSGDTFVFSDPSLGYVAPGIQFTGPVANSVSCLNGVSFTSNGSSINWLNECQFASSSSSAITNGGKIP